MPVGPNGGQQFSHSCELDVGVFKKRTALKTFTALAAPPTGALAPAVAIDRGLEYTVNDALYSSGEREMLG